jgi:outer membrane protein assembly factor BamB
MARLIFLALLVLELSVGAQPVASVAAGWPMYQQNAAHSGVDPDDAPATTAAMAWSVTVDASMYAQPLVVGTTVYVATENNTVYAFNTNSGAQLWTQHLASPVVSGLPCGNINPYGITGTPAIDVANGVLYAAALQSSPSIHHELYALNLNANGALLYHFPIDAPGSDPTVHGQRGGLALANGRIYVTYSGRAGDCGNYVGRVVSVNAGDSTGGSLLSYSLPGTSKAGIWTAASADAIGNVLVATGNSQDVGTTADLGESVVKLSSTLQQLDFFTAPEWRSLNANDTDVGSIAPTVLQNGWIFQSGKNGKGYLISGANMGHVGGQLFEAQVCNGADEALASTAYDASTNTVYVPCTSSLQAVRVSTTASANFLVTTLRAGYTGSPGSSPPIVAAGNIWNVDAGNRLLLGFDRATQTLRFSLALPNVPAHFSAPSAAAGHVFVPDGAMLVAFALGGAPVVADTPTPTATPTSVPAPSSTATPTIAATPTAGQAPLSRAPTATATTPPAAPSKSGGGGGGGGGGGAGTGGGAPAAGGGGGGAGTASGPPTGAVAAGPVPPGPSSAAGVAVAAAPAGEAAQAGADARPIEVAGPTMGGPDAANLQAVLALTDLGVQVSAPVLDAADAVGLQKLEPLSIDQLPQPPLGFAFGDQAFEVVVASVAGGPPVTSLAAPLSLTVRLNSTELSRVGGDMPRAQLAARNGSTWLGLGCAADAARLALSCSAPTAGQFAVLMAPPVGAVLDWDVPGGHVFKQANGFGGAGDLGYSVSDDSDAALWSEFQRWGGVDQVGYPITNRFTHRGFLTQAFQKLVLQWRPELGHAVPVNVFDDLDQQGSDAWLDASREVPRPSLTSGDADQAWDAVVSRHMALLDSYPTVAAFYAAQDEPVDRFGLPVGVSDDASVVSVRLQRATLQLWKIDVPWASAGSIVVGNAGDLAKEAGLWPPDATVPIDVAAPPGA